MFSGIIEAVAKLKILSVDAQNTVFVSVEKPKHFSDLKSGDSIAVNGVCLTLVKDHLNQLEFVIGAETLRVLKVKNHQDLEKIPVNLERSLAMGDRIHGHLVSGHVDTQGTLINRIVEGDCLTLEIQYQAPASYFIWKKGSVTLNGVSLTVNAHNTEKCSVMVTLIPETLSRTNLGHIELGQNINVEFDWMAKAVVETQLRLLKEGQWENSTHPKN